jgi:hypothetical protein|tara:strand:- start:1159 stop:1287 length:129 start_codon:yes stop_codon:yes gene_type:complete
MNMGVIIVVKGIKEIAIKIFQMNCFGFLTNRIAFNFHLQIQK